MTYGSFDYTSLLYLSDYAEDFGGGRFVFMDEGANRTVEPRAGRTFFALQILLVHALFLMSSFEHSSLICVSMPSG